MIIKGQLNGKKLGAKEAYYVDNQCLATFEDLKEAEIDMTLKAGYESYDDDDDDDEYEDCEQYSFDEADKINEFVDIINTEMIENGAYGPFEQINDAEDFRYQFDKAYKFADGDEEENNEFFQNKYEEIFERWLETVDLDDYNMNHSADEAVACENAEQVSNFYLMIDDAASDEELDNIASELESVRENGDLTDEEYNQILIEIQNRR